MENFFSLDTNDGSYFRTIKALNITDTFDNSDCFELPLDDDDVKQLAVDCVKFLAENRMKEGLKDNDKTIEYFTQVNNVLYDINEDLLKG
jgi:hypothetical protein